MVTGNPSQGYTIFSGSTVISGNFSLRLSSSGFANTFSEKTPQIFLGEKPWIKENPRIFLGENPRTFLGENSGIFLGEKPWIKENPRIFLGENSGIFLGEKLWIKENPRIFLGENSQIFLGNGLDHENVHVFQANPTRESNQEHVKSSNSTNSRLQSGKM